jgi:hypothetical protein
MPSSLGMDTLRFHPLNCNTPSRKPRLKLRLIESQTVRRQPEPRQLTRTPPAQHRGARRGLRPIPAKSVCFRVDRWAPMPHFQLVTTDGTVLGARELGRPDWPPGSTIYTGPDVLLDECHVDPKCACDSS